MQFKPGAGVQTQNGQEVGCIRQLAEDPRSARL